MANNCLVTKLKSVVNNDNLETLGGMLIHYPQVGTVNYNKRAFTIEASENLTLTVRNGYFVDNTSHERIGTSIDYLSSQGIRSYTVDNTDCIVNVSNKYALTRLIIGPDGYTDLNSLKYSEGLSNLSVTNSNNSCDLGSLSGKTFNQLSIAGNITGDATGITISNQLGIEDNQNVRGRFTMQSSIKYVDINNTSFTVQLSDFATADGLIRLNIQGTNATGNLSSLYNKPSLGQINVKNTEVTGTLEGYAENLWGAPNSKRSGYVILNFEGTGITLNDTEYFRNRTIIFYLVFENDNIKLRKQSQTIGEIVATYDGSTWTYNI